MERQISPVRRQASNRFAVTRKGIDAARGNELQRRDNLCPVNALTQARWAPDHAVTQPLAILTPFALASGAIADMRHFGIDPDDFHEETVDGVIFSAFATALVPPSASMICVAVIMAAIITKSVT